MMTLFTKVPGIYRTREGGYAYVKYIQEGTAYPVIGCKAQLMSDRTVQWIPNIMQAYTLDGRCMEGKDQAEDIVAYDSARAVLIFRPMSDLPTSCLPAIIRWKNKDGKYNWHLGRYMFGALKPMWFDIVDDSPDGILDVDSLVAWGAEWAELS
jgi:hypothetical protein